MQGPVNDIVLLLFLILFFGFQQRERPQLYFRFWFVGWMMMLGSYLVWEVAARSDRWFQVETAVRNDLTLFAGFAFVLSFMATRQNLPRIARLSVLILVPACAAVDLQLLRPLSPRFTQIVLLLMAPVAHGAAIAMSQLRLSPDRRLRIFQLVFSCGMALFMVAQIARSPSWEVLPAIQFEIFFFAAVYYASTYGRHSLAGTLGALGFAAWAIFYALAELLVPYPGALHRVFEIWNIPKYIVGFSMIVRIFEESNAEKNQLAVQYRSLYDDFRSLYQGHPHPMWILTADDGQFIAANDVAASTYGYFDTDEKTLRLEDIEVPPDDDSVYLAGIVPVPPGSRRSRLRCKNGVILWVNLYDRPIHFQGARARLIMARDVTDFIAFNSAMAHGMFHDDLTGLPNRRLLTDRLQVAIAAALRQTGHLAVMAIDVDHFKHINDTYGHAVGDACLKQVAERLRARIRQHDTVARVGGEEFIAVVSALRSEENTRKVAQELLRAFHTPLILPALRLHITISIGVALCPVHARDAETLHRLADQALYAAKRAGRNCVRFVECADIQPDAQPDKHPTMTLSATASSPTQITA